MQCANASMLADAAPQPRRPYNDRKGGQEHPVSGQVHCIRTPFPCHPGGTRGRSLPELAAPCVPGHSHTMHDTTSPQANTSLGVAVSAARALAPARNEPAGVEREPLAFAARGGLGWDWFNG
jgi:hypothetical protein